MTLNPLRKRLATLRREEKAIAAMLAEVQSLVRSYEMVLHDMETLTPRQPNQVKKPEFKGVKLSVAIIDLISKDDRDMLTNMDVLEQLYDPVNEAEVRICLLSLNTVLNRCVSRGHLIRPEPATYALPSSGAIDQSRRT